jgi:hypothetical protein
MLKLSQGKIDLPFSAESLEQVLMEGRDGGESQVNDEAISNWCYEFYLSYRPYHEIAGRALNTSLYRAVSLEVSTQWEADLENSEERVLSSGQFQAWLEKLRDNSPNNSFKADGLQPRP